MLSLAVVGAMLLIQEVAIVFFWARSISQSSQQLEAIIPQEVNMKVGLDLSKPRDRYHNVLTQCEYRTVLEQPI